MFRIPSFALRISRFRAPRALRSRLNWLRLFTTTPISKPETPKLGSFERLGHLNRSSFASASHSECPTLDLLVSRDSRRENPGQIGFVFDTRVHANRAPPRIRNPQSEIRNPKSAIAAPAVPLDYFLFIIDLERIFVIYNTDHTRKCQAKSAASVPRGPCRDASHAPTHLLFYAKTLAPPGHFIYPTDTVHLRKI